MLQYSTADAFTSMFVLASLAITSSGSFQQPFMIKESTPYHINEIYENHRMDGTGTPISFYNRKSRYFGRSDSASMPVDKESIKMQQRYRAIKESFSKNCEEFPIEKNEYIEMLSNQICKLHFNDNISMYNKYDESIDTIIFLSNGLKLSVSQFLDEDIDAPAVFSIHRGQALLISDAMPINEIIDTINSVVSKLSDEYNA